jgi:hypothetical protein
VNIVIGPPCALAISTPGGGLCQPQSVTHAVAMFLMSGVTDVTRARAAAQLIRRDNLSPSAAIRSVNVAADFVSENGPRPGNQTTSSRPPRPVQSSTSRGRSAFLTLVMSPWLLARALLFGPPRLVLFAVIIYSVGPAAARVLWELLTSNALWSVCAWALSSVL